MNGNPQMILPGQQPQMMMPQQQMMQPQQMQSIGSAAMNAQQMMPVSPNHDSPTSTQATLLISELRDNVVIMKDGSFRAVVACKSINFDLMSDMEREGGNAAFAEPTAKAVTTATANTFSFII